VFDEPIGDFNHFHPWHGQPRKHLDVLRIILEFGDVTKTVRGPEQVRLCTSPKWTQVLERGDASVHKHLLGRAEFSPIVEALLGFPTGYFRSLGTKTRNRKADNFR